MRGTQCIILIWQARIRDMFNTTNSAKEAGRCFVAMHSIGWDVGRAGVGASSEASAACLARPRSSHHSSCCCLTPRRQPPFTADAASE